MNCGSSNTSGLVIGNDGITVDLNHHIIDGPGTASGVHYGIENSDGFANATVKNGTIQLYRIGVFFDYAVNSTVKNVAVKLEGGFVNIGLESDYSIGTRFIGNHVKGAGAGTAFYNYYSVQGLFSGNKASDSDLAILEDTGTKNRFVGNTQSDPRPTSVGVDDTSGSSKDVYDGNTFNGGQSGFLFEASKNTKVIGNTANGNSMNGFDFGSPYSPSSLTALDNVANNNGQWGFYSLYPALGGHNHAHGNGIKNCEGVACD